MITKETCVHIDEFEVRFMVFDDKEWFVQINNNEEEYGASGDECHMNWNKGLAEAFVNVASMMSADDVEYLFYRLIMNENIDNGFKDYLGEPYSAQCYGCPWNKECTSIPSMCSGM